MEGYFLNTILRWKLSLSTPADFVLAITSAMEGENATFAKCAEDVRAKAVKISDLLLMCRGSYNLL